MKFIVVEYEIITIGADSKSDYGRQTYSNINTENIFLSLTFKIANILCTKYLRISQTCM